MQDQYLTLDQLGILHATDKSRLGGNYLAFYHRLFEGVRDMTFNLIEIGVFHGGSVRMWADYFSAAKIVGVDIDPGCRQFATDRIAIEIGSQADPEFLHTVVTKYPPLAIIDDGSHRSDHIIFTFERLFPTLQPGGWYIVEDLHFHTMPGDAARLLGDSTIKATDYFIELARDRMQSPNQTRHVSGMRGYILNAIAEIQVIPHGIILRKTEPLPSVTEIVEQVRISDNWLNWLNYGMQLKEAVGATPDVIEALRTSVKADPSQVVSYERLAEALVERREFEAGFRTLEDALNTTQLDESRRSDIRERAAMYRRLHG